MEESLIIPKLGSNMPRMGMRKGGGRTPKRHSLADALFSTTQQRVLGLLFGQPDRSFYATEMIALTADWGFFEPLRWRTEVSHLPVRNGSSSYVLTARRCSLVRYRSSVGPAAVRHGFR